MPIDYEIDHARRVVMARAHGELTTQDVFGYQSTVWSRPDVAGFGELMDMSAVMRIDLPTVEEVKKLARLAVEMDAPATKSKFAIFAPQDLAFGIGRMFAAYRSLDDRSAKQVGVFRSLAEALAFLGVDGAGDDLGLA
jgi:hypothetical protein